MCFCLLSKVLCRFNTSNVALRVETDVNPHQRISDSILTVVWWPCLVPGPRLLCPGMQCRQTFYPESWRLHLLHLLAELRLAILTACDRDRGGMSEGGRCSCPASAAAPSTSPRRDISRHCWGLISTRHSCSEWLSAGCGQLKSRHGARWEMSSLCLTGQREERGGDNGLVTSFFPCSLLWFNLNMAVHDQVVACVTRVEEFWSHKWKRCCAR